MRPLIVLVLLVATAHADPPSMTPPTAPPAEVDSGSYRLQTALCDVATLVLLASSAHSDGEAGVTLGLISYVAAAPIVHLAHHHPGRAAASIALRLALPLVAGAIGSGLGKSQCDQYCDNDSDIAGTAFGILIGAVAASAIDIGYLSSGEDAKPAAQPSNIVPPPAPIGPAEPHQVRVGLSFAF